MFHFTDKKIELEKSYTVVGYYERAGFESFSAPGYTAITIADENMDKDAYYFSPCVL